MIVNQSENDYISFTTVIILLFFSEPKIILKSKTSLALFTFFLTMNLDIYIGMNMNINITKLNM